MDYIYRHFQTAVKDILFRDYVVKGEEATQWVQAAMQQTDLFRLYQSGYTEEATAQKIFEENS